MQLNPNAAARAKSPFNDDQWGRLLAVGISILYLVLSWAFTRYRNVFEMDPDEGNNLVKALLLDRGYRYVTEIWSDQPPLFSYALRTAFRIFGWKVAVARQFVMLTSAVLVFAIYDSVRFALSVRCGRLASHLGAIASLAFLLLASGFASLRVSAMIGVPSIACAALSFWALLRSSATTDSRRYWQLIAGVLFGLSLCFKLFTAFLVPVIGLTLIGGVCRDAWKGWLARLRAAAIWFGLPCLVSVVLGLLPCLDAGAYTQLVATHSSAWLDYKSTATVSGFLQRDPLLFACAVVGIVLGLRQKLWLVLPFAGWLLVGLAALCVHNPLWAHHNQLLVIPATYLAGIAVVLVTEFTEARARKRLQFASLVIVLASLLITCGRRIPLLISPSSKDATRDEAALRALKALSIHQGVMVTSRQIYAFYLGLAVPPKLSVTSAKRFRTGHLDADTLAREVRESEPQLILLSKRWPLAIRNELMAAAMPEYQVVYEDPDNQQLVVLQRRK